MSEARQLVIPCLSGEFLRWFLEHTAVSVVYVSSLPIEANFPLELRQIAAQVSARIDLAIASGASAREVTQSQVNDGDTLLFLGDTLRDRLPSLTDKPEIAVLDMFLSMNQDYRKFKQQGRAALLKPRLALLAAEAAIPLPTLPR